MFCLNREVIMSFKKNMGSIDRIVRIVIAIAFAALIATGAVSGVVAIILGVLAAVFLLTSFVSFCPLYTLVGLSTAGKE